MTPPRRWSGPHSVAIAAILPLLFLVAFAGITEPQAVPPIAPQSQQPFQVSVNVDLVVLDATVRDRNGQTASDLGEQDFEVYEDGARQSIRLFRHEDVPVTVGLVVDHSGSMRPKLDHVIAAARTFVQSSSPEDEMFVVNFNERVTLGLPDAVRFTNRPDDLARAISHEPAAGKTALYDAVAKAQEQLQAGSRDKKVLIVISDGGDNASAHTLAAVLKVAEQSRSLMYTIGIFDEADEDKNLDVLRRLAGVTGGEAFFPSEYDEVIAICERIARDIRHQYTIGYFSANTRRPGAYRSIKVVARAADKSKLVVRTRSGYIARDDTRPLKVQAAK